MRGFAKAKKEASKFWRAGARQRVGRAHHDDHRDAGALAELLELRYYNRVWLPPFGIEQGWQP
jgi:hypothetical protein